MIVILFPYLYKILVDYIEATGHVPGAGAGDARRGARR